MGKRKSSKKPQGPKRREPLATEFTCLFCNHTKAVTVKINKKDGVGNLYCNVCGQTFQCHTNYLSAAVDVYAEWVDAADTVAKEAAEEAAANGSAGALKGSRPTPSRPGARPSTTGRDDDDDEEDDRQYEGEGIVGDDEEY